jgi:hypothetical protein
LKHPGSVEAGPMKSLTRKKRGFRGERLICIVQGFSHFRHSASEEEEVSNSSPQLYEYISYPRGQLGRAVFSRVMFSHCFSLKNSSLTPEGGVGQSQRSVGGAKA